MATLPPVAAPADNRQRAYAEWYWWALRHLAPEPARAHAAAEAMLGVFDRGGDQAAAMQAGSAAAAAPGLPDPAQARARSYAEWFSWAQTALQADFARAHAAAAAALQASDAGLPAAPAAQAAAVPRAVVGPAVTGGGLLWQFSGPALWPMGMGLIAIVVPIFTTFYFPILPIFGAIGGWRAIQRGRRFGGAAAIVLNVLGGLMSLLASGLIR